MDRLRCSQTLQRFSILSCVHLDGTQPSQIFCHDEILPIRMFFGSLIVFSDILFHFLLIFKLPVETGNRMEISNVEGNICAHRVVRKLFFNLEANFKGFGHIFLKCFNFHQRFLGGSFPFELRHHILDWGVFFVNNIKHLQVHLLCEFVAFC